MEKSKKSNEKGQKPKKGTPSGNQNTSERTHQKLMERRGGGKSAEEDANRPADGLKNGPLIESRSRGPSGKYSYKRK